MRALTLVLILLLAACGRDAPLPVTDDRAALQREITLLTASHPVGSYNEFSAAALTGTHGNPDYLALPPNLADTNLARVSHVLDPREAFIQREALEQYLADTTRLASMAEGLAGYDHVGQTDHPGWSFDDSSLREPVLALLRRTWALVALERPVEAETQLESIYRLVATFHGAGSNEAAIAIGRLHEELDLWAAWVIRDAEDPDGLVTRLDAARPRGLSVYHHLAGEAVAAVDAASRVPAGGQPRWHHEYADRAETLRAMAAYLSALRSLLETARSCTSLLGADCAQTFIVGPFADLEAPEPELERLAHVLRTAYTLELQIIVRRVRLRLYARELRHDTWLAIEQDMRETAPVPSLLSARWHTDGLELQELAEHPMRELAPPARPFTRNLTPRFTR
jgi:hypothetical protein